MGSRSCRDFSPPSHSRPDTVFWDEERKPCSAAITCSPGISLQPADLPFPGWQEAHPFLDQLPRIAAADRCHAGGDHAFRPRPGDHRSRRTHRSELPARTAGPKRSSAWSPKATARRIANANAIWGYIALTQAYLTSPK